VSIPNTLFRELKLNHHLLTALDVDNSLWHWGIHENDKLKFFPYPEDSIKPQKLKDITLDPSSKQVLIFAVDDRPR
jgi:hypothetical protein